MILTDILGLEDALGTMDFKVAGNADGISAFQLDIKCDGLTLSTLRTALHQAQRGRRHILAQMLSHLAQARDLPPKVPRILQFTVPSDALGRIIGPKGKTIQGLIEVHHHEEH